MGFFKSLFYSFFKSKALPNRSTIVPPSFEPAYSQTLVTDYFKEPVLEPQMIRSDKDVERILALPYVKVKHVIDGDTFIVDSNSSQIKIRLDSIDCPEKLQKWGGIATGGLIKIIGGKSVKLEEHGSDVHGRTIRTLFVYFPQKECWQNVNERMVTLGHAWVMRRFYNKQIQP